ncbi:hypothetical protein ACRAWD_03200 [Caulobacter segnis]
MLIAVAATLAGRPALAQEAPKAGPNRSLAGGSCRRPCHPKLVSTYPAQDQTVAPAC